MTEQLDISPDKSARSDPPAWLNPYQLETWFRWRDNALVDLVSDWNGLNGQIMYGSRRPTSSIQDLMEVLQSGRLAAMGQKSGGEFEPIPAIEWMRMPIAPLDQAQQHPYFNILFKREDVLAIFPATGGTLKVGNSAAAGEGCRKVASNRQLNHGQIEERAREMLAERPSLARGAAAAAIVAELPRNPRTGKLRDARYIERIIGKLWVGGF